MAWKETPRGLRVTFWVSVVVGVAFLSFVILALVALWNFRPI